MSADLGTIFAVTEANGRGLLKTLTCTGAGVDLGSLQGGAALRAESLGAPAKQEDDEEDDDE